VLLYDKLDVGGTEKLIVLIANLLNEHGHKITIVLTKTPKKLDHLISPSVEKIYLNRVSKYSLKPLKKLANICRSADIVHVHTYFNYRYYLLAKTLFGSGNSKVVLHEHSNMFKIKWLDKRLFRKLDAVIAVSAKQKALIKQWKTLSSESIFLLSNIISVSNKVEKKQQPQQKILMVGNIRREKNYELALKIVEALKGEIKMDIYGNINDEEYYNELSSQLTKRNLSSYVNIISGESDVSKFFQKYDLALHTASHETGPLVLMEYLSAGLPFFSSTAGQTPSVISEHIPEVVVSSYDAKEWVSRIKKFYNKSQDERNSFSEEMKVKAELIIDVENYYKKLLNIYEYARKN
jgi:glycosyltransferase involved in cell wall biosynthesis